MRKIFFADLRESHNENIHRLSLSVKYGKVHSDCNVRLVTNVRLEYTWFGHANKTEIKRRFGMKSIYDETIGR